MIVVDTNIIGAFCELNDKKEIALQIWEKDKEWHAPLLWLSELRNALLVCQRHGLIQPELFSVILSEARELVPDSQTHNVGDERVMDFALRSGCTAYDCEFIAVAEALGAPLLTWDKQLLKQFPKIAIAPEEYLKPNKK